MSTNCNQKTLAAALLLCGLWGVVASPRAVADCTIGVVSGRVMEDGRPLLWKNRDASAEHNSLIFFPAGENDPGRPSRNAGPGGHIALVSTFGQTETKAWAGVNEAGFAILNSLIAGPYSNNGRLMKRALEECVSLDDFVRMLSEWQEGGLAANFGVIDAHGGAAIFEVLAEPGETPEYHRFDASDSEKGYLVRTNFSSTWGGTAGIEQYLRARELFDDAILGGRMDHRFVLRVAARDINGETFPGHEEWETSTGISRFFTRSASVIHGVAPGSNPAAAAYWVILGEPSCGIAVPVWAGVREVPSLLHTPGGIAPLNEMTIDKERLCYPNLHGTIMNTTRLFLDWEGHRAVFDYSLSAEKILFNEVADRVATLTRRGGSGVGAPPLAKALGELQARAAAYAYRSMATEQVQAWDSSPRELTSGGNGLPAVQSISVADDTKPPFPVVDSGE